MATSDQDRRQGAGSARRLLGWAVAAAVFSAAVFVAAPAVRSGDPVTFGGVSEPKAHSTEGTRVAAPGHWYSLDGSTPPRSPTARTALAFIRLDDPLQATVEEFGEPVATAPDINATTAHTWLLPGAAELTVVTDHSPDRLVVGVFAEVPPDSPVRLPVAGGLLVGQHHVADVLEHWGAQGARHGDEWTDYLVLYVECVGPYPVVVKFDGPADPTAPPGEQRIDRVLIAYADADPGTAGCPPP